MQVHQLGDSLLCLATMSALLNFNPSNARKLAVYNQIHLLWSSNNCSNRSNVGWWYSSP
jgi:hypothetical protein